MFQVRVPATSANLGPGFDCLGLALNLYNTITVTANRPWSITLGGTYTANLPTDESNLVWQTMLHLWREVNFPAPTLALHLESKIPPARGLGSSSAAIVGGLLAANVVAGSLLPQEELLQMADALEGHPDNVTPALYGGVTLSVTTAGGVMPRILARKPNLSAVVVIPDLLLKTEAARSVLPPEVPRQEAVFNIAHAGLVIEAFLREDYSLLREGMRDKLHQHRRAALIPGLNEALAAGVAAGAYGTALSGSGPTMIALTEPGKESAVAQSMVRVLQQHGVDSQSMVLAIEPEGAQAVKIN